MNAFFSKLITDLSDDVLTALKKAKENEESPVAKEVLAQIIKNADIAGKEQIALCQDCGTAVVFLELGQEAHIVGGDLSLPSMKECVRHMMKGLSEKIDGKTTFFSQSQY